LVRTPIQREQFQKTHRHNLCLSHGCQPVIEIKENLNTLKHICKTFYRQKSMFDKDFTASVWWRTTIKTWYLICIIYYVRNWIVFVFKDIKLDGKNKILYYIITICWNYFDLLISGEKIVVCKAND
jgi:hypothetical protein